MNIFEKTAYNIGKIKAQLQNGWDSVFSKGWQNPSLNDPTAWVDPYVWGEALASGRKPTTKAEFVQAFTSWVYICVKLNAQAVASVPLRLYVAKEQKGQKFKTIETRPISKMQAKWLYSKENIDSWLTKAEEIEEVTEHPFLELMKEVNPYNNARDLKEFTSMFCDLTGEAYWYLPSFSVKESKVPGQIWVIPSQHMKPVFGKTLDKAIDHYVYTRGGQDISIPVEDIIYFTYPNPNNTFTGFSTIKAMADSIYIQSQMNEFEISLFENKARPGGIFTPKTKMGKIERERAIEALRQKYAGAKKAGKMLIMPTDMDFIRDTMTPEEMNFIEGRKLVRTEIMLSYDIPEGALLSESSNRAISEVADYRHAKLGVLPRCKRIEEKINERLLPRYDEKLFCVFDNPVPEDKEFEHRQRAENVKAGIITRDEARGEIGKEAMGEGAAQLWANTMEMPIAGEMEEELTGKVLKKIKEILNG